VEIVGQGNIFAMSTFTIYISRRNSCRPVSCYDIISVSWVEQAIQSTLRKAEVSHI